MVGSVEMSLSSVLPLCGVPGRATSPLLAAAAALMPLLPGAAAAAFAFAALPSSSAEAAGEDS